jgi:sugar diacid utilization regulator
MYHIKLSQKVRTKIEKYIKSYRDAFLTLYDDTWLGYAEDLIKQQYIQNAEILRKTLYEAIVSALSQDALYWSAYIADTQTFVITVSLERRRLFLSYRENNTTSTRILVDLEIVRK